MLQKLKLSRFSSSVSSSADVLPFDSIPGPKPLPVIGNIWRYLPLIGDYKPEALFENAQFNRRHYGPIVRELITSKLTILHLFDARDIEDLFRQDGKQPHRRSHRALLKYRLDRPDRYRDGGLFPENGRAWQRQRSQFQRSLFSRDKISQNLNRMKAASDKTIEKIQQLLAGQQTANVDSFDEILNRWALASSLCIFMDADIDQLPASVVDRLLRELHDSLTASDVTETQSDRWMRVGEKCPHYKMLVRSQDYLYEFVRDQIDRLEREQKIAQNPFLRQWLIDDRLDKQDVISLIVDFLLAGLHTTSYTTAFLLYQLSQNKSIQDQLRSEIEQHLPHGDDLKLEFLEKLVLMRDCLKEVMRLNPVSIGIGRVTTKEMVIRNFKIPNNLMVIAHTQASSLDEQNFFKPNIFDPDRWKIYRVNPLLKPSGFSSLPFGHGPRMCLGRNLVGPQIASLIIPMLQHFDISFDAPIKTKTKLIHTIDGHFSINLKKL